MITSTRAFRAALPAAAVLVALAGCQAGESDTATKSNSKAVCAELASAKGAFMKAAVESADAPTAESALRTAYAELGVTLHNSGAKATDAKLKSALERASKAAIKAADAVEPVTEDAGFITAASALDLLCGGKNAGGSRKGTTVGATASACPLPVTFEVAENWKPKAIAADPDGILAELVTRGPYTATCEIDAKPAGHLGFLRVWTSAPGIGSPRQALDALLAGEQDVRKTTYTVAKVGGLPAVEVVYETYSELMEETRVQRAVAVSAPQGVAILHLGGLDSGENSDMLPAFELAKRTLTATS